MRFVSESLPVLDPPAACSVGSFGSGILYYCQLIESELDETVGWTRHEVHVQHVSTSLDSTI